MCLKHGLLGGEEDNFMSGDTTVFFSENVGLEAEFIESVKLF
jgi:hypothetical protein